MSIRTALYLALSAFLGTATLAVAETTYLPGAAEVTGLAGARFSSTLEVSNAGATSTTATIGLVPMAGKAAPAPVTRTLAAGESLRIPEALKTLFGLADGAAGTLTVTSDEPLLANLTTRNVAAPEGAYGLGLLPVPSSDLLGAGETGHSIWVSQSADSASGYRTNLSVTLVDPGTVVEVRVLGADGRVVGTVTVSAATPEVWQQPATALIGLATDLPVGRAEFEVKAGRATAYAVVNDNVTSDAIALQTERVVPGASDRLISGAALSPGHLGSFWSTDLRLFNPGSAALDATIQSVGASRAASAVVSVPAKGVVEVSRVLALLGFPEGTACALRVKADASLLVAARTNNIDPAGVRKGTFSAQQFVTSWPAGLLGAGSVGFFNGIDQTLNVPGARTNLAVVGGPEGAAGELVLRDAAGLEQGRTRFTRGPGEWGQMGVADWFATPGASAAPFGGLAPTTVPENARIDVSVATGALDAFVSRIDNGSGDAVTRPVALPGGGDCTKVAVTSFGAAPQPILPGVSTVFSWTVTLDPPSAELTSQSIRFDGEPEIELGKEIRSYARSFASSGPRSVTLTVRKGSCVKTRSLSFFVCGPLTLEPTTLPDGIAFAAYPIQILTASGATAPTTFTVKAGALPKGLTLSPAGEISGRAEEVGVFTFTIEAVDANGCSGTREYSIRLACPTLSIAPTSLPGGTVATPYPSVRFTVTGGSGTGTWSATGLPPGLALSTGGQVAGTPTSAGDYAVTVRFRDSSGCVGTASFTIVVCNTLVVGPNVLAAATAGVAYGPVPFTAAGATGAATWSVTGGTLPAGVLLDPATGALSGTPTVVGTFPFTVTATDTLGCTGSVAVSLVVNCPVLSVNPASLANGTAGVAYGPVVLTQTGGIGAATYAITAGALPAGLVLSAAGVLSGTPTVVGPFNFTVTATDANACTGTRAYTLTVDCPVIALGPAGLANGTAGAAYGPVNLTQTGGLGTVTYAVTAGALPAGMSLAATGVLSGTPTVVGPFSFTVTATDANSCTGTKVYSLVVDCPVLTVNPLALSGATVGTPYSQTVSSSGGIGASTFAVTLGSLPAGLTLDPTTGVISGTPTAAASYSFTITATDVNLCTGSRSYTIVATCPTVTVAPGTIPGGTVGTAYSQTVVGAGGSGPYLYVVSAGALPDGLTLNGATGEISGTPTVAALFGFSITATDQYGCGGATAYSVRICPVVTVTPSAAPQGTINVPYAGVTFSQAGGVTPATWSATGLPAGLTIDAASGAVSGTPTEAGGFPVTVTATDVNGCPGSVTFTLRICPEMTIAPATIPGGTVGTVWGPVSFVQAGSAEIITWSATGLPAGLTLDSGTGVLSGTPSEPGSFTVLVTATDVNGCSVSRSYPLVIGCPAFTFSPGALPAGTAGTAYNGAVSATSALVGGSYAYTLASGSLPAGLSLGATGAITGTPTAVGTFSVTIRATHSPTGCSDDQAYTITVVCGTITVGGGTPPSPATAGTPGYSHTFTATGGVGPHTFSSTGTLPTGLTLSAAGVLSGTPTAANTFNFTIVATDSATGATCTGSAPFTVVVVCPTITVTPTALAAGTAGAAYGPVPFSQTGGAGTIAWSATGLPTGLGIDPATGVLSGTPLVTGTFSVVVTATDANSCAGSTAAITLVIACQTITVTPTTLSSGTGGAAYSPVTFGQSNGIGTIAWSATGLPTGLAIDAANGILSGTPLQTGTFSVVVIATDANGCAGSTAAMTLVIACPTITVTPTTLSSGTGGVAYTSVPFGQTGGIGTITWSATGLPSGLGIDSGTGVLSGTPLATGTFSVVVTATDSNSCTGSTATMTLVIACPTITVTPATLAAGTAGAAYGPVTFSQAGGVGTIAWSATGLPAGLGIGAATGVLSGTPLVTGTFSVVVTATDSNNCTGATATITLVINCPILTVTPTALAAGTAGVVYGPVAFSQTGGVGAITWSATGLPTGLGINSSNGILSGAPLQTGTFTVVVMATDSNGCTGSTATISLAIACPTILPSPTTLVGAVEGSAYGPVNFTAAGAVGGVAWTVSGATLPSGLSFTVTGVLSGTPDPGTVGSYPLTFTATDGNGCQGSVAITLQICPVITVDPPTLPIAPPGIPYSQTLTASGGTGPYVFAVTTGTLPSGLSLDTATGVISGTPDPGLPQTVTITATDATGCTGSRVYVIAICQSITIDPTTLANGVAGVSYGTVTFTQTGTAALPVSWAATGLPNGLTLDPTSGQLSGTPTVTGPFSVTVTVTDANSCTGTLTLSLTIACPTITVSPASLAAATTGTPYSDTFTQTGGVGTVTFSLAGTLPAGFSFNSASGELSGTPTETGSFPITVTATDGNLCTGSRSLTFVVNCGTVTVSPSSLSAGSAGVLYPSVTFTQTGGVAPVVFNLTGTLPTGMSFVAGVLSGTPTQTGGFPITVTATDAAGCIGTRNLNLVIDCPMITLTPPALPAGTHGVAYGPATFSQSGGVGTIQWTATGLPAGMSIGLASGAISGTPTAVGPFTVTVTATDANGCTGTSIVSISVNCQTITVSPAAMPDGALGQPYGVTPTVVFSQTGVVGTTAWSATGLPTGLSINSTTGAITGTPSVGGIFSVGVTAMDTPTGCSGNSAAITLKIIQPPTVVADGWQTVGNTQVGVGMAGTNPYVSVAGTVLTNDSDPNVPALPLTAAVVPASVPAGASVTMDAAGHFIFTPTAVPSPGVPLITQTFQYTVSNGVLSSTGTVTITFVQRVWYVKNNATAGGVGRSTDPFNTLAGAETASTAGDTLFVFGGDLSTTGQNVGIALKSTQRLLGEAYGLPIIGTVNGVLNPVLVAANVANRPKVTNTAAGGNGVSITNVAGVEVRGLDLAGNTNAIDVTATGASNVTATITNNVVSAAGVEGIDVNFGSTAAQTLAIASNTITAGLRGIDVLRTSTGTATITAFNDNVIMGNTGGSGIEITGVTFDAVTGNPITTVLGGTTVVGQTGNGVSTNGILLTNVIGDLSFTDLDIYNDAGTGLFVSSTGALNAAAGTGFRIAVAAGVSTIDSNGGPAVSVSGASTTLPLAFLESTNSTTTGLSLVNAFGGAGLTALSVSSGSVADPGGASGTAVNVNGGNGNVTLGIPITNTSGNAVVVTGHTSDTVSFTGAITETGSGISITSNTGATVSFSGGLAATTGANAAFTATGGGTIVVCDENPCGVSGTNGSNVNTLTTTTGTALNVANTTIGASNLEFRSISSNGATKGIALNTTGSLGGLKVKGTGSAGSGGTIQSCTQRGAELIGSSNVSLVRMNFTNNATAAGAPCGSAALATSSNTGCNGPIYLQSANTAVLDNLVISGSTQQGLVALDTTGLTLSNSTLSGLGNGPDEDGLHVTNLLGTNTISSTSISGSGDDNVNIQNLSSTPSTINITGGSFNNAVQGSGLLFGIRSTADTTINISGVTSDNNFSGGIVADNFDTATMKIDVASSTITNNNDGIQVSSNNGNAQFDIHGGNSVSGNDFVAVTLLKAAFSTGGMLEGQINGNTITVGNDRTTDGIFVFQAGGGGLRSNIASNTINYRGTQRAVFLQAGQDGNGSVEATITGNTIDVQLDGTLNAVNAILAQSAIVGPGVTTAMCVDIGGSGGLGNTILHSLGGSLAVGDIRVRQRNDGTMKLPGYGGVATDTTAVASFLNGRNSVVSASTAFAQSTGFAGGAACLQPTIP